MRDALILEIVDQWELQAAFDADPANAKRRETLRECADLLRMTCEASKLHAQSMAATTPPAAQPVKRLSENDIDAIFESATDVFGHETWMDFARAIESAALALNGLGVE